MTKQEFIKHHAQNLRNGLIRLYLGKGKWTQLFSQQVAGREMYAGFNGVGLMTFNEASDYVYRAGINAVELDAQAIPKKPVGTQREGTQETNFVTFIH